MGSISSKSKNKDRGSKYEITDKPPKYSPKIDHSDMIEIINQMESKSFDDNDFLKINKKLYANLIYLSNKSNDFKNVNQNIEYMPDWLIVKLSDNMLMTAKHILKNKNIAPWTMSNGCFIHM